MQSPVRAGRSEDSQWRWIGLGEEAVDRLQYVRQTLITGSFNFTKAAETNNAENLLVIQGRDELMREYILNFDLNLIHAEAYGGIGQSAK